MHRELAGGPTTQAAFSQRFKNMTAVFSVDGATRLLDTSATTKWKKSHDLTHF
jgi:hypothetical protein